MPNRSRLNSAEAPMIFVAGPYFAKTREAISQNIDAAMTEGKKLFKMGFLALVVHNHTHHFEEKTKIGEPVYRAFDRLLILKTVDAIKCLRNWRASQGARMEVATIHKAGKPVFESDSSLLSWAAGKPHASVTRILLEEADQAALDAPTPDIKVALTLGPFVSPQDDHQYHYKTVLAAEEHSIQLWNAGIPALSPQRALCDLDVSFEQYRHFTDRLIAAGVASCALALPGWEDDPESFRQVAKAASMGLTILGDVASVLQFAKGEKGYYEVGITDPFNEHGNPCNQNLSS